MRGSSELSDLSTDTGVGSAGEPIAGASSDHERLLRGILDLAADTIVRFDPELRYDYVNDRTATVTGRPYEEWIGRTQIEMGFPPEDVAAREAAIRTVFETGESVTDVAQIANLGGARWYESQLIPQEVREGHVGHVVVISRDITDRVLAEQELIRRARQDPLTGLPNRLALIDEIDDAIESGRRTGKTTAVLLVDLDHFKLVNDSLGHTIGDRLLRSAAERLRSCAGDAHFVSRHGGDEFVVVMRNLAGVDDAIELAEVIVASFRAPLGSDDVVLSATASIGIAVTTASARPVDAHDMIREADTAMFVVKKAGRDGHSVFDEALHLAAVERLRIATELRVALERGELVMWYQPEVDIHDGSLHAVEALLRWHHPSGEIYPAGRFIDIATDTGLIVDIGNWAIREICAQAAQWSASDLVVRVNLAPRQLADPKLLDVVDEALEESGLDPNRLCVEITETAILQDSALVRENLRALSDRGVAIAIDDFGTGYASLTYLRRYHIDVIKIDRSFITRIATDERDRSLTAAVVGLARHLGMGVTVEGVEHRDQLDVLRELGCTTAQGYLYSPAVPADEIEAMLADPRRLEPR